MTADGRGRILIADDNPVNVRLLTSMLAPSGHEVIEASSGGDAIRKARLILPDVVLVDLQLPDIDGYEVCSTLKADVTTSALPVLLLASLDEVPDKLRALEMGAGDYISRPFNRWEVLARVTSHLRLSRTTKALREATSELLDKRRVIVENVAAAADIQRALLPHESPSTGRATIRWRFHPSQRMGGDLLGVIPLSEQKLAIYVADVVGHGVSAALVAVSIAQSLGRVADQVRDGSLSDAPADWLRQLDREYPVERFPGRFFTIAVVVLDAESGWLRYCNAGHPAPILLRKSGALQLLDEGGPVIGLGRKVTFEEGSERIRNGDRLLLYSDGVTEAEANELPFGEERLQAIVRQTASAPLDEVCDRILAAVASYRGSIEPEDDVAIVAVELTEGATKG